MCPYKNICLRDPKTPWVTAEIVKAINERKRFVRLFRKTRNPFIWDICKYLRNSCNGLIRNAKAIYIKSNLRRTADDPRKFWKSINNILKGPKKDVVVHEFIDNNTGEIIMQEHVCDFSNVFYANIGIANLVNATPKPNWETQDPGYIFDSVTFKETMDLIKEIDLGKDSCIEGIPTNILKEGFLTSAAQLQYLFNVSIEESTFPHEWAKGFINILPKGGNLKKPSNWRPITQTLLPAKMLEKIVQKSFFDILNRNNFCE